MRSCLGLDRVSFFCLFRTTTFGNGREFDQPRDIFADQFLHPGVLVMIYNIQRWTSPGCFLLPFRFLLSCRLLRLLSILKSPKEHSRLFIPAIPI